MRVRWIETSDPVAGITQAAHAENVTLIVMRHVRESGWRKLRGESLVDGLLGSLDNVDIHLVEAPRTKR